MCLNLFCENCKCKLYAHEVCWSKGRQMCEECFIKYFKY